MNSDSQRDTFERILLVLGIILAAAVIALKAPFFESFWLDETVTAWVTSGSIEDARQRALQFQGQSPLYYMLLWQYRDFGFDAEWQMRLPSLVFVLVSASLLFGIVKQLTRNTTACIAVLLFVTSDPVLRAACSARPYALALFLSLLSTTFLLSYLRSGRLFVLIVYVVSLIALFYAHYLFSLIIFMHLATTIAIAPERSLTVIGSWFWFAVATIPASPQLASLAMRRAELSFAETPDVRLLLLALFPSSFLLYTGAALVLGFINRGMFDRRSFSAARWIVAIAWVSVAPFIFFLGSLKGSSLWVDRYWLWQTGGLSLLGAMLIDSLRGSVSRKVAFTVLVALILLREFDRHWVIEPWRDAIGYVNQNAKDAQVFLYTGLVEAERIENLSKPHIVEYLRAPISVYPLRTQNVVPILSPRNTQYLQDIVRDLEQEHPVLFLAIENQRWRVGEGALRDAIGAKGYKMELENRFWPIRVIRVYR